MVEDSTFVETRSFEEATPEPAAAGAASHRVVGEEAPRWLALGFALVGVGVAAAAAWLWLAEPAGPAPSVATVAPVVAAAPVASDAAVPAQAPAAKSPEPAAPVPQAAAVVAPAAPPVASPPQAPATGAAPAAAAAAPPAPTCPAEVVVSFGFDSAEPPRAEIDAVLAAVAEPLRAHAEAKVVVQGYADAAGTDQYNLLLSYRRAKAVATRLGEGGIAAQRIAIRAAGSHEPIAGLPPAAEQNRRATVQVRGFEGCR